MTEHVGARLPTFKARPYGAPGKTHRTLAAAVAYVKEWHHADIALRTLITKPFVDNEDDPVEQCPIGTRNLKFADMIDTCVQSVRSSCWA